MSGAISMRGPGDNAATDATRNLSTELQQATETPRGRTSQTLIHTPSLTTDDQDTAIAIGELQDWPEHRSIELFKFLLQKQEQGRISETLTISEAKIAKEVMAFIRLGEGDAATKDKAHKMFKQAKETFLAEQEQKFKLNHLSQAKSFCIAYMNATPRWGGAATCKHILEDKDQI